MGDRQSRNGRDPPAATKGGGDRGGANPNGVSESVSLKAEKKRLRDALSNIGQTFQHAYDQLVGERDEGSARQCVPNQVWVQGIGYRV